MKLADKNGHFRDAHMFFDEAPHIYYIDGVKVKTSVTTFIHENFPVFNSERVATFCHKSHFNNPEKKYYQMPVQEILAKWKNDGLAAAGLGTKMHKSIESYYNDENIPEDMINSLEFGYFQNFVKDFPELKPYRTEWEVYDEEHNLAGSIDMVYENPDGTLLIYDWKRSKEIKHNNSEKGFGILSQIPDANFWHYSIQLNTYKHILETKYGKTVTGLYLVIIHPNFENYMRLQVPDLSELVTQMFAERKLSLS